MFMHTLYLLLLLCCRAATCALVSPAMHSPYLCHQYSIEPKQTDQLPQNPKPCICLRRYDTIVFALACEGHHPEDAYQVESLLAMQVDVGIAFGSVVSLAWSAGPWLAKPV